MKSMVSKTSPRRLYGLLLLLVLLVSLMTSRAALVPALRMDYAAQGLNADEIALAECLQGLVNRSGPSVYYTTYDNNAPNPNISSVWFNYLTNDLGMTFTNVANFRDLIRRARNTGSVTGLVRYSSSEIGGAQVQVAITLAAQLKALPVTDEIISYQSPGLMNKGTDSCFSGLPVLADMRGWWTTNFTARQWAVTNLLSKSSRKEVHYDGGHWFGPITGPGCCSSAFCARDYAVLKNAFCFDFPISQAAYSGLFSNIMTYLDEPAAVLGVWPAYGGGEDENSSTAKISQAGNYWLLTHMAMNISFLSGISVTSSNVYLRKNTSHLTLDNSKYYVLFETSEGDTIKQAWHMPGTPAWTDSARGTIPIAWGVNPVLADRLPVYLRFLKTKAGAKDTFFCGPNGIGYTWMSWMSPSQVVAFGQATEPYLKKVGLQLADLWGVNEFVSPVTLQTNAPSLQAFTEAQPGVSGGNNMLLTNGIPLARSSSNLWYGSLTMTNYSEVVSRIQAVAAANPPPHFIVVYDTVDPIMQFAKICATNLGSQYVIVGAEDFVDLMRQRWASNTPPLVQKLANPSWDPTTTNGSDGGRNWTFQNYNSIHRAYQLNDLFYAGHIPVVNGSKGLLKVEVSGTNAGAFVYATSDWVPATPGSSWKASVWARNESLDLHGDQVGVIKLIFGNSSYSEISNNWVTVVSTNDPNVYKQKSVSLTAGAGTAYVRVQAGIWTPSGGGVHGHAVFDDAALLTPGAYGSTAISASPATTYVGQTVRVTVTLPASANLYSDTWLWVSNSSPAVVSIPGQLEGRLPLYFPVGTTNSKSFNTTLSAAGTAWLTASSPACSNSSSVLITAQSPSLRMISGGATSIATQSSSGALGDMMLAWPVATSNWQLQGTSDLVPPVVWETVTNPVINIDQESAGVMLSPDSKQRFFRLEMR